MRNKFIQKRFGECFYVCMANITNDESWIKNIRSLKKGVTRRQQRNKIERKTDWTLDGVFATPIESYIYIPVFDWEKQEDDVFKNGGWHSIYFASLLGSNNFNHCVLVIKETGDDMLNILDPQKTKTDRISKFDFFKKYKCREIELLRHKKGHTLWFNDNALRHLYLD